MSVGPRCRTSGTKKRSCNDLQARDLRRPGIAFNAGYAQKLHQMALFRVRMLRWPNGGPRC